MYSDLLVIKKARKKSDPTNFDEFVCKYFNCHKSKWGFINNDGEKLNISIANDFYEDYAYSNNNFDEYVKNTTFNQ